MSLVEYVPYPLLDLYFNIFGYLESLRLNPQSGLAQISEQVLGENGKDLSAVDALLFVTSTTGTLLTSVIPEIGIPLACLGYIPMIYRRGPLGAALPPMVVYTAIKNPQLGAKLAQEAAQTAGETAREAVKLGFTVTGTFVTASGVIVGYIFSRKKKTMNK
jgi:hypothetical protein